MKITIMRRNLNKLKLNRYFARSSLIDDTLKSMENDEFPIKLSKKSTMEERKQRRRSLDHEKIPSFSKFIKSKGCSIERNLPKTLQLNIGLFCNQACNHCHVESSPKRTEKMNFQVAERCIELIKKSKSINCVDLTGGAPELNPAFRYLVTECYKLGVQIIDRCNLTVLMEPGQEDLVDFLKDHEVRVVASLPCYSEKNVNMQRGRGIFDRSIQALSLLNRAGYGDPATNLILDLVYNPLLGTLPPNQKVLEQKYKEELYINFNIVFNSLITITNMPIKRFADLLHRRGELDSYMNLLVENFNASTLSGVMCKDTVSVGWDGSLYDCDFNQQLDLFLGKKFEESGELNNKNYIVEVEKLNKKTVFDIESLNDIVENDIYFDLHCFGCTAGSGSSCSGAINI